MLKRFVENLMRTHREMIVCEGRKIGGFYRLLMKHKNTGLSWTRSERAELKRHIRHLSMYVPVLAIFLLPFGSLLIPVLAELLDRRRTRRTGAKKEFSPSPVMTTPRVDAKCMTSGSSR